ncbi:hypothetical protein [Paraburkholderia aromaticivorans]|uniref:hypothetical protein n=1 Tax=Paraburkholderia aromaticivorans TaxID=2026199 RepID=UPI0012FD4ED3|nr:hypothetical protein [Paraburkholderia aromaticivorans]
MLVLVSNVSWLRSVSAAHVKSSERIKPNGSNKKARFCVGISGLHVRGKAGAEVDECGFSTIRFSCFGLPRVRKLSSNRRKPSC